MEFRIVTFLIVFFACLELQAQPDVANVNGGGGDHAATINNLDTVVFDISQAIFNLNSVSVPVYILSDDTVNALDFSMKYDHSNLIYDSVHSIVGYLQAYSYYNVADSTIRFTSNSMHRYGNDSILVAIHFFSFSGQISSLDMNSILVYLNGDLCAYKIINAIPNGIQDINNDNTVTIFPNPGSEVLHITSKENSTIRIYDLNGSEIMKPITKSNSETEINLRQFSEGIYIIKVSNGTSSTSKRIIVTF